MVVASVGGDVSVGLDDSDVLMIGDIVVISWIVFELQKFCKQQLIVGVSE